MSKTRYCVSLKIFEIYKDFYGKPPHREWMARVFSHTNTFNSQWPLQSLRLKIYGGRLIVYVIFACIRHAS